MQTRFQLRRQSAASNTCYFQELEDVSRTRKPRREQAIHGASSRTSSSSSSSSSTSSPSPLYSVSEQDTKLQYQNLKIHSAPSMRSILTKAGGDLIPFLHRNCESIPGVTNITPGTKRWMFHFSELKDDLFVPMTVPKQKCDDRFIAPLHTQTPNQFELCYLNVSFDDDTGAPTKGRLYCTVWDPVETRSESGQRVVFGVCSRTYTSKTYWVDNDETDDEDDPAGWTFNNALLYVLVKPVILETDKTPYPYFHGGLAIEEHPFVVRFEPVLTITPTHHIVSYPPIFDDFVPAYKQYQDTWERLKRELYSDYLCQEMQI